uniref:Uncharacterized protein n=1 Tax=Hemiselmis andersenii TaxID=464988 RepID=A0A7S1ELJ2_HEMAN
MAGPEGPSRPQGGGETPITNHTKRQGHPTSGPASDQPDRSAPLRNRRHSRAPPPETPGNKNSQIPTLNLGSQAIPSSPEARNNMFSMLYALDSFFHHGLPPQHPTSLLVDGPSHTSRKARLEMLAVRPWNTNPPPINPPRFVMESGRWHL